MRQELIDAIENMGRGLEMRQAMYEQQLKGYGKDDAGAPPARDYAVAALKVRIRQLRAPTKSLRELLWFGVFARSRSVQSRYGRGLSSKSIFEQANRKAPNAAQRS